MIRSFAVALTTALLFAENARPEPRATTPIAAIVSAQWEGPDAIDLKTLRRIYLGQRTRIRGHLVRPFHLPLGSREREIFARRVLEKSSDALEHYWIRQALEGGPLPPREVSDAEAMIHAVRSSPTTLGYVALSDLEKVPDRSRIRVLRIEVGGRALATSDPDYPLHVPADR